MKYSDKREIVRFLLVGTLATLIDLFVYRFLHWADLTVPFAKGVGFIVATVFAFYANKNWTFRYGEAGLRIFSKFLLVYSTNLGINVGANSGVLIILGESELGLLIAFLIAAGISATLNFIGMKFLVFRTMTSAHEP